MSFSEDRVRSRDVPSKGKRPDGENNRQPGKPREPGRKDQPERGWTSRAPKVFRLIGSLDSLRLRSSPPRQAYSEFAGHRGLDATRYGDWEYSGRCTDF
jgi:hypothetical protein